MATIYGLNEFVLTSTQRTWSPDKGDGWQYVYVGPLAKADEFFNEKKGELTTDAISMDKGDGEATITVAVADDDGTGVPSDAQVTWELIGQDISKDLMTFEGRPEDTETYKDFTTESVDSGGKATPEQMSAIRKGIELADPSKYGDGVTNKPEIFYRRLMEMGVREYTRSSMILRKTISCGRRSLLTGSWVGVDRAWTYSGGSGSPNVGNEIGAILLGQISDHPDYKSGGKQWLKKAPQIQQQSRKLFTITQEWWFARAWSEKLYGGDGIGAGLV